MCLLLCGLIWTWISVQGVYAALSNRTIDDQFGDSVTKIMPVYAPDISWHLNFICPDADCAAPIDATRTLDNAYHGGAISPTMGFNPFIYFSFTGVELWIFAIWPRFADYIGNSNVSVYIDGLHVDNILNPPDDANVVFYNQLGFHSGSLPNTEHNVTLIMELWEGNAASFLFDYAIYAVDETSTSTSMSNVQSATTSPGSTSTSSAISQPSKSSVPVAVLAGGIVGGVFAIISVLLVVLCLRHRARRGLGVIRRRRHDGTSIDGAGGGRIDPYQLQPDPEMTSAPRTRATSPQIRFASGRTIAELGAGVFSTDPRTAVLGAAVNNDTSTSLARARSQKTAVRQKELAQQVKEMERAVANLRAGHQAADAGEVEEESPRDTLNRRMEAMQLEIERLKVEQEEQRKFAASALELPPAYEPGRV